MEHRSDDHHDAPGSGPSPTPIPVLQRHAVQLLEVVEPVIAVARSVTGFFFTLALLSVLGGVLLVLMLVLSVGDHALWKGALIAVAAVLLLSPGLVLLLFRVGLTQLIAIPDELAESVGQVEHRSERALASSRESSAGRGLFGRLVTLLRSLVDVRSALLQSRDVFTKGAVLMRVANPVSLVVVLVAAIVSLLIVAVAAIAALAIVI